MPTSLFESGAPDVLYIVDFSGYVFRAYHAIQPLHSPNGEPTQAVLGTVTMLEKLVRQRVPKMLAVAMDSTTRTFRKEVYAEYKAHRPPQPPDLTSQMAWCRQIVDAFAIPVFQKEGFEADDLIASAVAQARERKLRVVIVSADKDLMQLVGDDVLMWDTMRDKVFGPPEVVERFGVPIAQVRDWLALTGDSSDNIPGVASVGPKTATELLSRFATLDGIYQNLESVERKGLREKLREHEQNARLSQRLVTLRSDVPCVFDPETLRYGGRDVERLRQIYAELGFQKQLAALSSEPSSAPSKAPAPPKPAVPRGEQMSFFGDFSGTPTTSTGPSAPAPGGDAEYRTVSDEAELERVASEIRRIGKVAIVAEMSSSQPMRATLVGIGLSVDPGRAVYLPVHHRYVGVPNQVGREAVIRILGPLLSDAEIEKAAHDAKELGLVLARAGLALAGVKFDSLLASYLIDPEESHDLFQLAPKVGLTLRPREELVLKAKGRVPGFDEVQIEDATRFSASRADAVRRLSDRLGTELTEGHLTPLLSDIELPLSEVLAEMERVGVLVDANQLRELGRTMELELQRLEREAHDAAGKEFNVNSPRQLETLLFDDLGLKPLRRTKTSRSTDADTLEALAEHHRLPKIILEIRQIAKLKGTYVDALPTLLHPETGRIHTNWGQAIAATGRLSSSDPNLQNIPIRSELGRSIRSAFVAPPGYELVSADYSQIELRVLAHLSKDPVLIDAFRSGQDIHTRTAIEIFGVAEADVDAEMRRRSKAVNFGIIYGQGDSGLAKSLGIPRAEAASFIAAYFRRYEGVRKFMNDVLQGARASESVRTLFGRRRLVPDIGSENRARRLAAERVAMNTPIQGTAADLLKLAMLAFRTPPSAGARMVLTVHDELVFEVPVAEVAEAEANVRKIMEGVHPLEVPLVVDVGHGANWNLAH
jgi:DNA polymerase-1